MCGIKRVGRRNVRSFFAGSKIEIGAEVESDQQIGSREGSCAGEN